jgi:hypothetical protein
MPIYSQGKANRLIFRTIALLIQLFIFRPFLLYGEGFSGSSLYKRVEKLADQSRYTIRVDGPQGIQFITFDHEIGVREEAYEKGKTVIVDRMTRKAFDGKIYIITYKFGETLKIPRVTICDGCTVGATEYFMGILVPFSSWELISENVSNKGNRVKLFLNNPKEKSAKVNIEVNFQTDVPDYMKIKRGRETSIFKISALPYDEKKLVMPTKYQRVDLPDQLP